MPYTSFGLFKAVRSHQIESPSALGTSRYGKPNACNLCHLDQTLSWAASHLSDWYGHKALAADRVTTEYASAASMLLKGDAVQRVIAAWHFGHEEARAASGDGWQVPLLAELLNDGYAVIRYVAGKSIRRYPGMDDLDYDFLASEERRIESLNEAIGVWSGLSAKSFPQSRRSVFLTEDGQPDWSAIERVLKERDDRPLILPE